MTTPSFSKYRTKTLFNKPGNSKLHSLVNITAKSNQDLSGFQIVPKDGDDLVFTAGADSV
jgi:hypothetical protein